MNYNIELIDYFVIIMYIAGIFFLAFKSGKGLSSQNLVEDQYLAGRSLTFSESLFSIIATEVSALTFLGIPAFAYGGDFAFIQIYFGAFFGRIIIAKIMLPKIYNQGLTIYSVMGKFGTQNGQKAIAIFYSLNKFLAVGVRLFAGSIIISEFFKTNIFVAVGVICIITFFYTLIGGLKAVVRTDMIQMVLFILGGVVAHFLIPDVANTPWSSLMSKALSAGKTSFIDFNNLYPFCIGVFGGVLFDMATHGVDQDFVQRLTANKSMKSAQSAIVISSFFSIFVGLLFLSIGALLWSYYQTHTAPNVPNDKIFAHFITYYFPPGVKGLMVAGVLAATMSTLDSTINALSACLYNDIFRHKNISKEKISGFYKRDTLIISILLMLIAFLASLSDELLLFGLKITSWTAGSLVSIFFLTVIFKKASLNVQNVCVGYFFGAIAVYVNTFHLKMNWNWNVYFGAIFCSLAILTFQRFSKKEKV